MFKIIPNKPAPFCKAYKCKNYRTAKDRFCSKHSKRYQRETNLVGYTYAALRSNARRRGKTFTLTLDEFREFCEETGYLQTKGKNASSASIDRIDNNRGYEKGNIRLLSLRDNSIKWTGEEVPF